MARAKTTGNSTVTWPSSERSRQCLPFPPLRRRGDDRASSSGSGEGDVDAPARSARIVPVMERTALARGGTSVVSSAFELTVISIRVVRSGMLTISGTAAIFAAVLG